MAESHKVIALISGGKDSIYSILHCLANGHKVVALGNLYPPPPRHNANDQIQRDTSSQNILSDTRVHHGGQETEAEEHDFNSFMYQTVGHTVIPLYEQALGIPLYRRAITGAAVQTDNTSYEPGADGVDETESLVPLLRTIMIAHPEADALSTGAILSTYQRTRVESVALRLGLVPLSFLWQYPALRSGVPTMTAATTTTALLQDMAAAGLVARIIKVASGGLDESFLWENVASARGWGRLERAMARFEAGSDGAVLGEGGEFETLVLDGPDGLFKGRIVVGEADRRVVREGGGAAWLSIQNATLEIKAGSSGLDRIHPRRPELLESRFEETLDYLQDRATSHEFLSIKDDALHTDVNSECLSARFVFETLLQSDSSQTWTVSAREQYASNTIEQEMGDLAEQLRSGLKEQSINLSDVISVVILLRSMKDFSIINKVCDSSLNVEMSQIATAYLFSPEYIYTLILI
jgi:diphthine-ammonia ligase